MKNRAPSVVFLAFLSAFPASAQTNTFPASGNADIGTTSPVATLDIVSGQTITGTRLLSGNSSQYTAFVVGRTSTANDVSLGVAGTTGNWNPVRDEKLDPADVYTKGGSVAETPAIYASLGEVGRSNPWITLNALRALKGAELAS